MPFNKNTTEEEVITLLLQDSLQSNAGSLITESAEQKLLAIKGMINELATLPEHLRGNT